MHDLMIMSLLRRVGTVSTHALRFPSTETNDWRDYPPGSFEEPSASTSRAPFVVLTFVSLFPLVYRGLDYGLTTFFFFE